jgi:hypothetical protein
VGSHCADAMLTKWFSLVSWAAELLLIRGVGKVLSCRSKARCIGLGGPHSRPERKKKAHPWIAVGNTKMQSQLRAEHGAALTQLGPGCGERKCTRLPARSMELSLCLAGSTVLRNTAGVPFVEAHLRHFRSNVSRLSRFECCVSWVSSETLAKSTKPEAVCKQRRSSEVVLHFVLKFHRELYSCCQTCM